MNVPIRDFTSGDYDAVSAIHNAALPDYPMTAAELASMDQRRAAHCLHRRFLVETAEGPIAWAPPCNGSTCTTHGSSASTSPSARNIKTRDMARPCINAL